METGIENVIQRLFPDSLADTSDFEDWCSTIRQDAQPGAADFVALLKDRLDHEIAECRKLGGLGRDYWELFGGEGDKAIKSASSIRSKLARDLMGENISAHSKTEDFLRRKILAFSDLGRARIITDFPSDITHLREKLFAGGKFLGEFNCPKGFKDFVFDPSKRDGLKGHRAIQFSAQVPIDDTTCFGFEVQFMTRLQHAWDRRNHPLYEWQREKPDWISDQKAVELAVDDFACAEALHLVDRQADHNWQRLQNLIGKKQ